MPAPPQLAAWNTHLKNFRADHPNMSLKDAMKAASKTFTKSASGRVRKPRKSKKAAEAATEATTTA